MPVYQDKEQGTWFVKCYYKDYTGKRRQRKKRGFKLQRDAKEWERNFLETHQQDLTITFDNFVRIYLDDMGNRLRENTFLRKKSMIQNQILPFFGNMELSQISVADIRRWQNEKTSSKKYKETYLRQLNVQLSAIFNYAVRYYGLGQNPCTNTESIGKSKANRIDYWTHEEFNRFVKTLDDLPERKIGFLILYYTGMRIGELLALTIGDIDIDKNTIAITKSLQRINKTDIITPPKTPKSVRTITIPLKLSHEIEQHIEKIYDAKPATRLINLKKNVFNDTIRKYAKKSGLKEIRLHDLRHSHASLLINMGISPLVIAERLGHENVETTLNTYSHIFPHKKDEVAELLDNLIVPF